MADFKASQLFWKTLFGENEIASQLPFISTKKEGVSFTDVGQFGEVNFKCHPASKLGDNFMSDTFIGMATTQDGTNFRTFIKILPSNSLAREFASSSGAHQREISMYTKFFDSLRLIREEKSLSQDDLPLDVPHVYYTNMEGRVNDEIDGSSTCILMEDVAATGYRMVDKYAGCDDSHVRLSLSSLAHYHALSIASLNKWRDQDGKIVLPDQVQFLTEKNLFDFSVGLYSEGSKAIITRLQLIERPDLAGWIEEACNTKLTEIFAPDTIENIGPMVCVQHGDFWCNNLLYKYEELENQSRPTEVKMVDFQIARFGHPVSDLLYLVYTSTLPDVRKENMTSWLNHYFTTLMESLQKLGIKVMDYIIDDFMVDYKKRSMPWMMISVGFLLNFLSKEGTDNFDKVKKFMEENPDSDEEGEKGPFGCSVKMGEKIQKFLESQPPNTGDPAVNDRIVKLMDEVLHLNGITLK